MALWLVRAGRHGEYEKKFLDENRIYLTWDGLSHDLAPLKLMLLLVRIGRAVWPARIVYVVDGIQQEYVLNV